MGRAERDPAAAPAGPGLYIHVPFCSRKCAYCAFYSVPGAPADVAAYLRALDRDLARRPRGLRPTTVFIGGGTPTSLADGDLARLLESVAPLAADADEWSIEANPGTVTRSKARRLRAVGVTRVSLGAQSFHAPTLRRLGRAHAGAAIQTAWDHLRAAGPARLGLDLIYGVPGLTHRAWEQTLAQAVALAPEHISAYCLTLEPGTPLARAVCEGAVRPPPDSTARRQYETLRALLAAAGYAQYEISNFARPGGACRHNLLYWSHGAYWACGPAACGHWRGRRFQLAADLAAYCHAWERGRRPVVFSERLAPQARAREALLMGLRRTAGWTAADFRRRTGFDLQAIAGAEGERLLAGGFLLTDGQGGLRLAPPAYFISDAVLAELA